MSKAEFWQRGEAIDYTNNTEAAIEANEIVVFGNHIGVAGAPIAIGETGTLHVSGVFEIPKKSEEKIEMGEDVGYDKTAGEAKKYSDEDILIGYATEAADATDATVKVKLQG